MHLNYKFPDIKDLFEGNFSTILIQPSFSPAFYTIINCIIAHPLIYSSCHQQSDSKQHQIVSQGAMVADW